MDVSCSLPWLGLLLRANLWPQRYSKRYRSGNTALVHLIYLLYTLFVNSNSQALPRVLLLEQPSNVSNHSLIHYSLFGCLSVFLFYIMVLIINVNFLATLVQPQLNGVFTMMITDARVLTIDWFAYSSGFYALWSLFSHWYLTWRYSWFRGSSLCRLQTKKWG
jgi:hypothetical protein